MDAATRELLEAIRDAMALPPGVQRLDATDSVFAILNCLLSEDEPTAIAAEARWLRKELAAIKDGGGMPAAARREIAALLSKRQTED